MAAIAYAVAGLQSSTYTAQSNVVVTSAPGPVGSSSAGASGLASTYAGALPNDPTLQSYVAKTAHVNPLGTIVTLNPKGSVITVEFFGTTRAKALAGARAIASGLSGATPASSVVSSNTLTVLQDPFTATLNPASVATANTNAATLRANAAAGVTTAATPMPPSATYPYMATTVLMVPLNAGGPAEGINPDDADKLATTYAGVIPVDQTLLSDVGNAVHQTPSQVASNLSVVNEQNTSILQISYKSSDPRTATTGARTAASLLSGANPVAAGIVPSSLQIVSLPNNVGPAATTHKSRTIAIGALLGLILGVVLLVAWERSDPHVTDARSLSGQFGCPATPADRLSPDAAHALLDRWASLTDRVPARVAILPADAASVAHADEAAHLLAGSGDGVRYICALGHVARGAQQRAPGRRQRLGRARARRVSRARRRSRRPGLRPDGRGRPERREERRDPSHGGRARELWRGPRVGPADTTTWTCRDSRAAAARRCRLRLTAPV